MDSESFRELQRDLGLDASDLADELGISIRTIERYRSGRHKIPSRVKNKSETEGAACIWFFREGKKKLAILSTLQYKTRSNTAMDDRTGIFAETCNV